MSRYGVTGQREDLPHDLASYLQNVKRATDTAVAVGFGISRKEHMQYLKAMADVAVVGSAIVDLLDRHRSSSSAEIASSLTEFVQRLNSEP
jgi:tryptophan synthase alpha chain